MVPLAADYLADRRLHAGPHSEAAIACTVSHTSVEERAQQWRGTCCYLPSAGACCGGSPRPGWGGCYLGGGSARATAGSASGGGRRWTGTGGGGGERGRRAQRT